MVVLYLAFFFLLLPDAVTGHFFLVGPVFFFAIDLFSDALIFAATDAGLQAG